MSDPERKITIEPLTRDNFAPYGEVIEKDAGERITINRGKCIRHHALATAQVAGDGAHVIVSIFAGQPYDLPHMLDMVERHPLGSQAFYPLSDHDWLVIVCDDERGVPVRPRAFRASAEQGINLKPGQWHGVLTPLEEPADFLVVDRGGPGDNLEEHFFNRPYEVES